jgi:hypothetical protein
MQWDLRTLPRQPRVAVPQRAQTIRSGLGRFSGHVDAGDQTRTEVPGFAQDGSLRKEHTQERLCHQNLAGFAQERSIRAGAATARMAYLAGVVAASWVGDSCMLRMYQWFSDLRQSIMPRPVVWTDGDSIL